MKLNGNITYLLGYELIVIISNFSITSSSIFYFFFFLNDTATPKFYPLPLPDPFPIYACRSEKPSHFVPPDGHGSIGAAALHACAQGNRFHFRHDDGGCPARYTGEAICTGRQS